MLAAGSSGGSIRDDAGDFLNGSRTTILSPMPPTASASGQSWFLQAGEKQRERLLHLPRPGFK